MAKETGLGWTTLDVDDSGGTPQDLMPNTTNLSFSTPRNVQDVTGIDKSAMERLHLLADFSISLNGVFDSDAADSSHDTFVPLDNVRTVTIVVSAQSLPNECLFTDYALTRAADGSLTFSVPGQLADGTVPVWA